MSWSAEVMTSSNTSNTIQQKWLVGRGRNATGQEVRDWDDDDDDDDTQSVMKVTVAHWPLRCLLRDATTLPSGYLLCSSHIGNKTVFFRYFTILYLKFK